MDNRSYYYLREYITLLKKLYNDIGEQFLFSHPLFSVL